MSGIRIRSIPGCGWGVGRGGGVKVSFYFSLFLFFYLFFIFVFILLLLVGLISEGVWADFNPVIVIYDAYRVL